MLIDDECFIVRYQDEVFNDGEESVSTTGGNLSSVSDRAGSESGAEQHRADQVISEQQAIKEQVLAAQQGLQAMQPDTTKQETAPKVLKINFIS